MAAPTHVFLWKRKPGDRERVLRSSSDPAFDSIRTGRVRIWSGEHGAYWGPNGSGYWDADHRDRAGIYTFEEAYRATAHTGPEKQIVFERVEESGTWTAFQLPYASGWQVTTRPGDGRPSAMTEGQAEFVAAVFNLASIYDDQVLSTEWMQQALAAMADSDRHRATGTAWRPIFTAPESGFGRPRRYVLVRGPSGMVGVKHFVVLAYHDAEYRPHNPWRLFNNGALSDFGWIPEEWAEVPE